MSGQKISGNKWTENEQYNDKMNTVFQYGQLFSQKKKISHGGFFCKNHLNKGHSMWKNSLNGAFHASGWIFKYSGRIRVKNQICTNKIIQYNNISQLNSENL